MSNLVQRGNTPRNLAVVGTGGIAAWVLVSLIPFFPFIMGALILAGIGLHYKNR